MSTELTLLPSRAHQREVIERSKDCEAFALFMEQGTGKTHVGIATYTHLWRCGRIDTVLILAPNGVHDNWVRIEIPKHSILEETKDYQCATWHSNNGAKANRLWEYVTGPTFPAARLAILAANIEAVRTEAFWKTIEPMLKKRKVLLILDESTTVKNIKAQQTKNAIHLADRCAYKRIMTGTPITQSPLDLYGQFRFLGKGLLPFDTYTVFKHTFAIETTMYMGARSFQKIVGYRNQEYLSRLIAPHSFRVLKKDCLDLPPKVYSTRFVEMNPRQRALYTEFARTCVAQLPEGLVTVTTVLTMLMRLHQITLGYVPTDDGQLVRIAHERINVLKELLEEGEGKTIIFCRFLQDIDQVSEALPAGSYVQYTGSEEHTVRSASVDLFQNDERIRYFVATKAAARGLTLTAATHVVYYSQDYSLEARLQSEDRAHRDGQRHSVLYTDLCARETVEEKIVAALQAKKDLASSVMDRTEVVNLLTV